ncbi:jg25064 [Pararge aegeria aegeria]|uniref:Jg25064 protein n=1 Tax=Pararge aegeria aegeria TaxID=348720 RepID=A0A8S4QT95_9NEOP|nr:jg25064 [Pararge aegeria aegeria]
MVRVNFYEARAQKIDTTNTAVHCEPSLTDGHGDSLRRRLYRRGARWPATQRVANCASGEVLPARQNG